MTGQLAKDIWDRRGQNCQNMTPTSRELWTRVSGLRSWDRTAGIEQLGQDNQDKTAGTGQPRQESWDRKVRKTDRIVQPG